MKYDDNSHRTNQAYLLAFRRSTGWCAWVRGCWRGCELPPEGLLCRFCKGFEWWPLGRGLWFGCRGRRLDCCWDMCAGGRWTFGEDWGDCLVLNLDFTQNPSRLISSCVHNQLSCKICMNTNAVRMNPDPQSELMETRYKVRLVLESRTDYRAWKFHRFGSIFFDYKRHQRFYFDFPTLILVTN